MKFDFGKSLAEAADKAGAALKDAGDKAGAAAQEAMSAAKDAESKMTLGLLKKTIEGDRKKVKENAPETYVTIVEMILKDQGAMAFSPSAFTLKGLHLRILIEMIGSHAEIAMELSAEAAKGTAEAAKNTAEAASSAAKDAYTKAFGKQATDDAQQALGKLGDESKKAADKAGTALKDAGDKAGAAISGWGDQLKKRMSGGDDKAAGESDKKSDEKADGNTEPSGSDKSSVQKEVQSFTVNLTVDMHKEMKSEDVDVTIADFETSVQAAQFVLKNPHIKKKVEEVIGNKVAEAVKENMAEISKKLPGSTAG